MSTEGAGVPTPPKKRWDSLFTTAPVVLTVIATVLAGLSSGEMTQAQYHRSLAAQQQSKASDQWSLFQAKRIRGTSMETASDLLGAVADPAVVREEDIAEAVSRVADDMRRIGAEAERLARAVDRAAPLKGEAGESLRKAAQALKQTTPAPAAEALTAAFRRRNGDPAAAPAGDPVKELEADLAAVHPDIPPFLQASLRHESDAALLRRAAAVPDDKVEQAITTAQAKLDAAGQASDPATRGRDQLNRQATEWAAAFRPLLRASRDANASAADLPAGDDRDAAEARSAASAVAAAAERIRATIQEVENDCKAERLDYNARRYRGEAGLNQTVAGLYELQVQRSGYTSDRHRTRSMWFFFGMLAAQLGVTIATLSLALRRRSLLVSLAALAGLAALLIAGYVFVNLYDWYGVLPPVVAPPP